MIGKLPMTTRAELEAAVARAEAKWRAARHDLDLAQAELAKASAVWDQSIADRRKASTDRRKPGTVWNGAFPDRRIATTGRRMRDTDIAAFSKKVSDQHRTYLDLSKARADFAAAKARADTASLERDQAIAALGALDRTQP
jgi:hypothetical protein